ncbi:MAG: glycosyltransferase family 2 protein [Ramlibacter sp.]
MCGRDALNDDELLLERKLPPTVGHDADLAPPVPRNTPGGIGRPTSQRPERPSLSLVLPCRNEARNLETLLPLLLARLSRLADRWEVVMVDDGSTDDTTGVMRRWAAHPGFRCVELSRNFGKEAALTAGLEQAQGQVVVSMDADLQHPPRLLEDMLAHWRQGADVVYAVRANRDDEGVVKRWGTRAFYRLLNAFEGFEVPPDGGDFRLMDRAVVLALLSLPERNRFMKGLYAWVGFQAVALPYVPGERAHGRSHFNLRRLLSLSLIGLTAFTTWPLRLATVLGMLVAIASLGYGAVLTVSYWFWGNPISGWTTIVVGVALLLGLQMVMLGIMGEYIGRIFQEVKARPLYVIRDVQGQGLKAPPR